MILDKIVAHKKQELITEKHNLPVEIMQSVIRDLPPTRSLTEAICEKARDGKVGLIAEIKKGSPSKGIIRSEINPVEVAEIYNLAGAAAISVLTDEKFFYGSPDYLRQVRQVTCLPILRKEFIVDKWQIYQSRYLGADAILLIAAILDNYILEEFIELAAELGMDCLVEIHSEEELERVLHLPIKLLGINNRNLKNFKTDINTTNRIYKKLIRNFTRKDLIIVSESGINIKQDIDVLKETGVHGILVGEALIREKDIACKIKELIG